MKDQGRKNMLHQLLEGIRSWLFSVCTHVCSLIKHLEQTTVLPGNLSFYITFHLPLHHPLFLIWPVNLRGTDAHPCGPPGLKIAQTNIAGNPQPCFYLFKPPTRFSEKKKKKSTLNRECRWNFLPVPLCAHKSTVTINIWPCPRAFSNMNFKQALSSPRP